MKAIRLQDPCVACRKIGAKANGYAYCRILGVEYALCFKHLQVICKIGRPVREETYGINDPTLLGLTGTGIIARRYPGEIRCQSQEREETS